MSLSSILGVLLAFLCTEGETEAMSQICFCTDTHHMVCQGVTKASTKPRLMDVSSTNPASNCSSPCTITHLTLTDSSLTHSSLSPCWFSSLGLCPQSLHSLTVRNSTLSLVSLPPSLSSLTYLDLRGNLGQPVVQEPGPRNIDWLLLSCNSWPCVLENSTNHPFSKSSLVFGEQMSWLLQPSWSSVWRDKEATYCGSVSRKGESWYDKEKDKEQENEDKREERRVTDFLEFVQRTSASCPPHCQCLLAKDATAFKFVQHQHRDLKVTVDCSSLSLTQLPDLLPNNTIFLDLSNNKIASLAPMANQKPAYEMVEGLCLLNNSLKSLAGLETSWMMRKGGRRLDVQNNNIRYLDTLMLEPILAKSLVGHEPMFYLSGNPWTCSCDTIKTMQDFIEKYSNIIMDAELVSCSEFAGRSLLMLDYKELCRSHTPDTMLWVILLEVLVTVAMLGKFVWDCVTYRRTGQLPWLARKLCGSTTGITRPHWADSSGLWRGERTLTETYRLGSSKDKKNTTSRDIKSHGGRGKERVEDRNTPTVRFL